MITKVGNDDSLKEILTISEKALVKILDTRNFELTGIHKTTEEDMYRENGPVVEEI